MARSIGTRIGGAAVAAPPPVAALSRLSGVRLPVGTAPTGGSNLGGGTITHGDQITASNTGHLAYFDAALGRTITAGDMTTVTGAHWLSDFVAAGGSLTRRTFTGFINIDIDNVTFNGCNFAGGLSNYLNGRHATGTKFNYCTMISAGAPGDDALNYQNYIATRCQLGNCSDGAKANGGAGTGTQLIECYIRVAGQNTLDHNDGIQNAGGDGLVIAQRCNISATPTNGQGAPDAAILSADFTAGTTLDFRVVDCLLDAGAGAVYTLRAYDGGASPNARYTVTGNKFTRAASGGPFDRGTTNTTPLAQVTWSNNTFTDGTPIPLS